MLRSLETRPAISVHLERDTVESRDLNDEATFLSQQLPTRAQASRRIVVVLEEVPHCDEVEALISEVMVVEQAAPELDVGEAR